jgi:hypothetical protein
MADVPPWERLSDAIARVMGEAGLSRDEAQTRICRAIADGAVKIRGKLGRHTTTGFRASNTVLEERDFHIAPEIKPEHLDWEQSRPVKPWVVRREAFKKPGHWELEWIELFVADVTNFLCSARPPGESAQRASRTGPALKGKGTPVGLGPRSTAGPQNPGAVGSPRRRGAQPKKFEQARDAMRNDIQ